MPETPSADPRPRTTDAPADRTTTDTKIGGPTIDERPPQHHDRTESTIRAGLLAMRPGRADRQPAADQRSPLGHADGLRRPDQPRAGRAAAGSRSRQTADSRRPGGAPSRSHPGYTPGPAQWVYTPDTGRAADRARAGRAAITHRQYERGTEFGRRSLLVLRVADRDGRDIARVYQGFSPEKALEHSKRIMAFWNGEQFASLDAQPLVIDRSLRLFVFDGVVVMKSNSAYEALFGPLPDLRVQAAATYQATLGKLQIVGGDELQAACRVRHQHDAQAAEHPAQDGSTGLSASAGHAQRPGLPGPQSTHRCADRLRAGTVPRSSSSLRPNIGGPC